MLGGDLGVLCSDLVVCFHGFFDGLSARMWGSTCSEARSGCSMTMGEHAGRGVANGSDEGCNVIVLKD